MKKLNYSFLTEGPKEWEKDFKDHFLSIEISAFGIGWFVLHLDLQKKAFLFGIVFFFIGVWSEDE